MRWVLIAGLLAGPAWADGAIAPGRYEVTVETTMPNLDLRGSRTVVEVCWRGPDDPAMPLGPMAPGPMRDCPSRASEADGALVVETACPGRGAGFARTVYRPRPGGFTGRAQMNMGGKNMTVGEVQRGRRLGPCG